jgi:hypothetical protein
LRGSRARQRAVRWALARYLGYRHLWDSEAAAPGWVTSVQARLLLRRLSWECPPFIGAGRLLDAGCGSGAFLGLARAATWRPVYGLLKLFLEAALPLVNAAGRGEVIRVGMVPTSSGSASFPPQHIRSRS